MSSKLRDKIIASLRFMQQQGWEKKFLSVEFYENEAKLLLNAIHTHYVSKNKRELREILEKLARSDYCLLPTKEAKDICVEHDIIQTLSSIRLLLKKKMGEKKAVIHDEEGEKCCCKYLEEDYPCENKNEGYNKKTDECMDIIEEL